MAICHISVAVAEQWRYLCGMKAASVQFNHRPGDKAYNLGRVRHFVEQAAEQGVELICFPEMCITGYWHVRKLDQEAVAALAEPVPDGPSSWDLLQLANTHHMTVSAGLIEAAEDGRFYNTQVVAMADGRVESHRKLHCFISEHMASGETVTVFDTPHGVRVAVLICYDNNIGENVRLAALNGADVLLAPHQTGGCHTPSSRCMGRIDTGLWLERDTDPDAIEAEILGPKGREWLMRWLPARAHDNGIFLIFSNGIGIDDDEVRTGNAMIIDPYGEVLAETWKAADTMVVADLDLSQRQGSTGQRWISSRRPELYERLIEVRADQRDTRDVRFERI
jgi:predicted amidohydrolase